MSIELQNASQFMSWLNTKSHLNSIAPNATKRFVKRGQVYWCHFGINIGSEMSKTTPRPAIIISNYGINKSSPNVIVVPVTHNASAHSFLVPIVPIKDGSGKIILDGKADTANVICVSKARLGDQIATLPSAQMRDIDRCVALTLDLLSYYDIEKEKYDKLTKYVEQVKKDRNIAQDTLDELKKVISRYGFDDQGQNEVKKLLDIK